MAARPRPDARERALRWLYTGPPGHLYSAAVDLLVFWTRWGYARVRGREPFEPPG